MLLSEKQLDTLKELINIGVGKAANLLNDMVQSHVKLSVPKIKVDYVSNLQEELVHLKGEILSAVKLGFKGTFSGTTEIVFPVASAQKLVSLLTGERIDSPNLDSLKTGTLNEIANILLNSVMGVIANLLETHFRYELPAYSEESIEQLLMTASDIDQIILFGETHFEIEQLQIEGNIIIILELSALEHLKTALNNLPS